MTNVMNPSSAGVILDVAIIVVALIAAYLKLISSTVFVAVFSAIAGARISHLRPPKGPRKPPFLPGSASVLLLMGIGIGVAHLFNPHERHA